MPRRSRRALLELVGSGTAALLAGCQADSTTEATTERSTPAGSPTPTSTASDTATDSPTETLHAADCDVLSRPDAAWPVPRRSPAWDGYVADQAGFEAAPTAVWEAEPSAPEDSYASPLYGRPVVAHDMVYLVNRLDNGPQRPMYGHLHALDAPSGDRRWASERLRSPSDPAVWGDLAVVVAEDEDLNTMTVASDRTDGTDRWTREFADRARGFVPTGDHLYLTLGRGTSRGTVHALADDGSTAWSRERAFAETVTVDPTVGPALVYLATRDGQLHALNRDDGTSVWTYRFEHATEDRPYITELVATDCNVVAVVEGALRAVDVDGTLAWEVGGDHGSLATDGETVYTATGFGDERELQALHATTGELRWTVGGPIRTPPVVTDDAVYMRLDEHLVALDRDDGEEQWRTAGSLDDLALADGTLDGTSEGTLQAWR